jgi:hypothetical protein
MGQDHYGAFWLPDGRHFMMLIRRGPDWRLEVVVGKLGSDERTPLLSDVAMAQYVPGRIGRSSQLLFVSAGRLFAQGFDDDDLQLTGSSVTVVSEKVAVTLGGGLAAFSVSPSGRLAYRPAAPGPQRQMALYDRKGNLVDLIGDGPGHPRNIIRFSPTGKKVAYTKQGATTQEVWIADWPSFGNHQRLTPDGRSPAWSPDGSEIAFLREEVDVSVIYRGKIDVRKEERVWSQAGIIGIYDWSSDGQYLLLGIFSGPRAETWLLRNPLSPSPTPELFVSEPTNAQFVPSEGSELRIVTQGISMHEMPGPQAASLPLSSGGNHPRFSRDGRELFYQAGGHLNVIKRVGSTRDFKFESSSTQLFPLPPAFRIAAGQFVATWDVTPDGRFLIANPPPDTTSPIRIITNWDVKLEPKALSRS